MSVTVEIVVSEIQIYTPVHLYTMDVRSKNFINTFIY